MSSVPLRMRHYPAPHDPRVVIAEIVGEIDVANSMQLLEFMIGLIGQGCSKLVIDLDNIEFVDSSGIDVLVGVFNRAQRDGASVVLSCQAEAVLKHCASAKITKFFSIWPTQAEATSFLTDR
jgi:anti-sigma B factor antagonist